MQRVMEEPCGSLPSRSGRSAMIGPGVARTSRNSEFEKGTAGLLLSVKIIGFSSKLSNIDIIEPNLKGSH